MRVLLITNQYPTQQRPGSSPCIKQQKDSLERLGFCVDVLLVDGPASRVNYLKAMVRVFWEVQIKRQYDLIHAHYGFSGLVARFQLRCPVVVTFRGSDVLSDTERPISRLVARVVDQVIVMSDEMKRLLGREDARIIPYGIDTDAFAPGSQAEARQALELDATAPLVFFPYDPRRPEKRYDMIILALKLLEREYPAIQLVTTAGQPYERMPLYMRACDVLVLASDWEGAPLAIREAMACNLPIVSVDVGDVVRLIGGIGGCHICARSPDDIAAKLACVLRERTRTGSRSAALELGLSRPASQIAEIYKKLLGVALDSGGEA